MPCIVFLVFLCTGSIPQLLAQENNYLSVNPLPGDGILSLLSRYMLLDSCSATTFYAINELEPKDGLNLSKSYQLPVMVYAYNGKSIRTTIGISNYNQAKKIELYNDSLRLTGVKKEDYRTEEVLWVPQHLVQCYPGSSVEEIKSMPPQSTAAVEEKVEIAEEKMEEVPTVIYPLLGKDDEVVDIRSDKLSNNIYYLVSGHGGPDPGAIGNYNGFNLCEDEYAYDITLRLANNLIRHGAEVYVIVQDTNDGIRNKDVLPCDNDEVSIGGEKIPYNQVKRLRQRADTINELYRYHRDHGNKNQRLLVFHVDSRQVNERVDMFFYHDSRSKSGHRMAEDLRKHIDEKYGIHQKTRGYDGSVKQRNLYMLKNTLPTTVYIELGNIRNDKDQKRFLIVENRQAIANWFTEGIIKHEEKEMVN